MKNIFKDLKSKDHKRYLGGLDVFRYIGPGLLVTVGFIDPVTAAKLKDAYLGIGVKQETLLKLFEQHNAEFAAPQRPCFRHRWE